MGLMDWLFGDDMGGSRHVRPPVRRSSPSPTRSPVRLNPAGRWTAPQGRAVGFTGSRRSQSGFPGSQVTRSGFQGTPLTPWSPPRSSPVFNQATPWSPSPLVPVFNVATPWTPPTVHGDPHSDPHGDPHSDPHGNPYIDVDLASVFGEEQIDVKAASRAAKMVARLAKFASYWANEVTSGPGLFDDVDQFWNTIVTDMQNEGARAAVVGPLLDSMTGGASVPSTSAASRFNSQLQGIKATTQGSMLGNPLAKYDPLRDPLAPKTALGRVLSMNFNQADAQRALAALGGMRSMYAAALAQSKSGQAIGFKG